MARRKLTIELAPIVAAVGGRADRADGGSDDEFDATVLDATASLLVDFGLSRWSVDDVADRAGVGRTSVYRRFSSRDDLVHGVLARELRTVLAAIAAAGAGLDRLEDQVVEAVAVCVTAVEGSVVGHLLRNDPGAMLPLLTTGAGPLLAIARSAMAPVLQAGGVTDDVDHTEVLAEALARLGLSFLLTPDTVVPVHDPTALRAAVRALVGPVLRPTR